MIGSYFVPVEMLVRFMKSEFSWMMIGLFCHERVCAEKLDNDLGMHLSWKRGKKLLNLSRK
jgi:hypothetical protein